MTGAALLVTGAAGRLGHLLRLHWPDGVAGLVPLWTARRAGPGVLPWHIGQQDAPPLPPGSIVLHLAAELRGEPGHLARNAPITAEVCAAARQAAGRHVFVASSAAVYRPGPDDLCESTPPDPVNPYGAAKLAAEQAALREMSDPDAPGLTILRIGNVAGADALLGRTGPATLDPVAGQIGGPLRSYIGPGRLARVLEALITQAAAGQPLPQILNIAEPGVVAMADLLTAAGRVWQFGPPQPGTVPRVGLDTTRLQQLAPLPPVTARGIAADLDHLKGCWP